MRKSIILATAVLVLLTSISFAHFPSCHPDYDEYISVGMPYSWHEYGQCRGNADGQLQGNLFTGYYYVGDHDLTCLFFAYKIPEPPEGPGIDTVVDLYGVPGIAADFDHRAAGSPYTGYYRVGVTDLCILSKYWEIKEPPDGPGISGDDCLDCDGCQDCMQGPDLHLRIDTGEGFYDPGEEIILDLGQEVMIGIENLTSDKANWYGSYLEMTGDLASGEWGGIMWCDPNAVDSSWTYYGTSVLPDKDTWQIEVFNLQPEYSLSEAVSVHLKYRKEALGDTTIVLYNEFYESVDSLTIKSISGVQIIGPNGTESLISGDIYPIMWQGDVSNVKIEYSDSNGSGWTVIDANTPSDGQFDWTVPELNSEQCLVRVSDASDAGIKDVSDGVFMIYQCQLDSPADLNNDCKVNLPDFAIFASDWLLNGNPFDSGYAEPPITAEGMVWVYINDPGVDDTGDSVPDHEPFQGFMSKYETTNAQYCQFLNEALASGDIAVIVNNIVFGANGSNSGADFVGKEYFDINGDGIDFDGASNGGASRINYDGNTFIVDSGFENHPVTYVGWYGATAFCNYYNYRMPTTWEWQAVADYDGTFTYGCGPSINNSIANYRGSTHPDGTSVVGDFGTYGYGMCDMAGNVWEWTSTVRASDNYREFHAGDWRQEAIYCTVSQSGNYAPTLLYPRIGFRVCR